MKMSEPILSPEETDLKIRKNVDDVRVKCKLPPLVRRESEIEDRARPVTRGKLSETSDPLETK